MVCPFKLIVVFIFISIYKEYFTQLEVLHLQYIVIVLVSYNVLYSFQMMCSGYDVETLDKNVKMILWALYSRYIVCYKIVYEYHYL